MDSIAMIILVSFIFFIFYVTKYFFTSELLQKRIVGSKIRLVFGIFMTLYGINQLFVKVELVTVMVGVLFGLFGIANTYRGFQQLKHYKAIEAKQTA
ncbi:hypothetical protein J5Y03_02510 [Bacillus sp. RG28]|uniref:YtpI-like protein n=1 Tax=Gottfriedia endophytica TaxID=2820819 RepID=A0A940SHL0_9BACI|nr:YtpI family protein [Gottfriedia endophytica]MBP0724055.1 hypothetical protein [Gottfriedia endophytica]